MRVSIWKHDSARDSFCNDAVIFVQIVQISREPPKRAKLFCLSGDGHLAYILKCERYRLCPHFIYAPPEEFLRRGEEALSKIYRQARCRWRREIVCYSREMFLSSVTRDESIIQPAHYVGMRDPQGSFDDSSERSWYSRETEP